MPYSFPRAELFVWGVGLLIVALLGFRILVARRRSGTVDADRTAARRDR